MPMMRKHIFWEYFVNNRDLTIYIYTIYTAKIKKKLILQYSTGTPAAIFCLQCKCHLKEVIIYK